MIDEYKSIREKFSYLGREMLDNLMQPSLMRDIPKDTEILTEGQYIKAIPLVVEGLIKVYSRYEDKELLLYYIQPFQSCIMSFSSAIASEPSRVFAITEEDTLALLLPVGKVSQWIKQFPEFNTLFYQQYNLRYSELLETINYLLYYKLDKRIYDYLLEKSKIKSEKTLNLKHKQIANELGTAREVVSRILKKLEKEGKIIQSPDGIEIIE
jgi:CRP/FNR family transcriptional regulator, anaerobic regulatory protein